MAIVTAMPIVLANAVSVVAQYAFFRSHLPHWGPVGAGLFAGALESMAVFLAYHAHAALMANDSASRLRLASYSTGLAIGAINASHFLVHGSLTVEAASVGLLSASSPWLWGIHSRRQNRDQLLALGLIEPHSVRLGSTRWTFHPYRCLVVASRAAWTGEQDVNRAMALVPQWRRSLPFVMKESRARSDPAVTPAVVYVVAFPDYSKVKPGMTSNLPLRLSVHRMHGYSEVIRLYEGFTVNEALAAEQQILDELKSHGHKPLEGREYFHGDAIPIILGLSDKLWPEQNTVDNNNYRDSASFKKAASKDGSTVNGHKPLPYTIVGTSQYIKGASQ
jgi:hypothetical protein